MNVPEIHMPKLAPIRWYSHTNYWMDAVIFVPEIFKHDAIQLVNSAIDAYWNDEFETYGDAIEQYLTDAGIIYAIIYHDSEDISDEYEQEWDNLVDSISAIMGKEIELV